MERRQRLDAGRLRMRSEESRRQAIRLGLPEFVVRLAAAAKVKPAMWNERVMHRCD
jgi:hypothetical protein